MWRDSTLLEGTLWIFALAALLAFGFASCQNKGSNPAGEDWQAMYEALSEEEQAKLGDGLRSVATSGLSKETIVDSEFDSTYAIDAKGENILFSIIMQVDTAGTVGGIEKFGLSPELDDENWNTYWVQATFGQITTLAGIDDILHIEAETEWYRLWKTLSEEERTKVALRLSSLYEKLYTNAPSDVEVKKHYHIVILTNGDTEGIEELGLVLSQPFDLDWDRRNYYATATLQQIVALARLKNVHIISRAKLNYPT